jgi:predicted HicB family RNase H-like nuclease
MNFMNYKSYSARIEYSDEDACFVGHIAGIHDVVGFHGESVAELRTAFEEAVDDYLAACKRLKRAPQRSYSGKVLLRIDPIIHAKAAMQAEAEGKSLNAWAQEVLQQAVTAATARKSRK